MKSFRGLPIRRSPRDCQKPNPSTPTGVKTSGWDRFNNKLTPEVKKTLRDKWNEFYPDDPLIPQPKYRKTSKEERSKESHKEYLRRMWNEFYPDDQIDWDNFKPQPLPEVWNKFNLEFASEEEMYRQDLEDEDGNTKYTPEQEMELWEQYYGKELDEWGNPIDDDPHPLRTKSLYNKY